MKTPAPKIASLLSLSALALSLTGCGGTDESSAAAPTRPPPSASAEATPPTDEEAERGTEESSDPAVAEFLQRSRNGLGEEGSAHVRMTMTGPVKSVAEGDSAYGPDGNEMRLQMSLPEMDGAKLEMLVVDGSTYMAMPGVTPPGKFFELPEESAAMGGLTGGVGGLSPADSFAGIEAGLERVEEKGSEELDGERTDRFELHVDTAVSMSAVEAGELPAGMPETLVYDVWLDREDRMRRVRYDLAGAAMTMDLTDWDKPFTVTAPAKKDLVEPPPGM